MAYKRNQVVEAISQTLGEASLKPSSDLCIRVKRLLDTDRKFGRDARSPDSSRVNFAFYSSDAPGKGSEVPFSGYEAFALLEALKLMKHEWPQGFVVSILRQARRELEKRHTTILRQDPKILFDQKLIQKRNESSNVEANNSAPEYLLIVSDNMTLKKLHDRPYPKFFTNEREAFRFQMAEPGRSCTWLELVSAACLLRDNLDRSLPRQRGRSA